MVVRTWNGFVIVLARLNDDVGVKLREEEEGGVGVVCVVLLLGESKPDNGNSHRPRKRFHNISIILIRNT